MSSPARAAATMRRPAVEPRAALRLLRRSSADGVRRVAAVVAAVAAAVVLSPWLAVRAGWGRLRTGRWLTAELVLGRHGRPLRRYRFAGEMPGAGLPGLWHIAAGDCGWIGPRPVKSGHLAALSTRDLVRLEVAPGLISPAAIRQRMGLAHDGVARLERSMALEDHRLDASFAVRALLAACLGSGPGEGDRVRLFGVDVDDRTMADAVDELATAAAEGRRCRVAFVNPDCLNIAFGRADYRAALGTADRVYADGVGVRLAARWRGHGLRDNVNGTDLFPRLCARAERDGLSIYLLGAEPGVADAAAAAMVERFPGLSIAGAHHGFFSADERADVCRRVDASGADIVLVAMGAPRQDLWLRDHHGELGAPVVLGVGGLFDYYSGRIKRAPEAWRDLGLEWLFRLTQEPGRLWRRYVLGNPLFVARTLVRADRRLNAALRGAP